MPHQATRDQPPEGVLACGCTTDVIDRLYADAGLTRPPHSSPDLWASIEEHVAPHLGPFRGTLHDGHPPEATSDGPVPISVDVLVHGASPSRQSLDLVTAGMSVRRMRAPRALRRRDAAARAELVLRLPAVRGGRGADFEAMLAWDHVWAVRWLAIISRIPHEFDGFLGDSRDLPTEFRCMPLLPLEGCPFDAVLAADPKRYGRPIPPLQRHGPSRMTPARDHVRFLSLVPLYADELAFAVDRGVDALFERLAAAGVEDIVDPGRPPVA